MTIPVTRPIAMAAEQRNRKTRLLSPSVHRDSGEFHHLAPLFGLVGHQLAEFRRRHRLRDAADVGKSCDQLGILERLAYGLVENVDDLRRRALRGGDAIEPDRL